jgi:hypothetical protein
VVAESLVSQVGRELKPTKRRLAELRPTESDVELLNVSQLISDLWEEGPPAECVHVFVDVPERPTTGTSGTFFVWVMRS